MLTYLFLILIPCFLLAMWASARVKGTFAKYSKVPLRSGYSGADAAAAILQGAGIHNVQIEGVPGMLSDHYDPRAKVVRLSKDILNGRSAAAVAVAAHEVGHAIQDAQDYQPMRLRASLVPAASFGSGLAPWLIIFGLITGVLGLAWVGVIGFAAAVLFHLVTLPVEYDASARAIRILEGSGIVAMDEMPGVRKTLYAAGFTYVASTLVALVQLLYWVLQLAGASSD